MLKLTDIEKSFACWQVLSIKELQLPGGLYRIRGANGSGKSTLLNILAGMIPFRGEILLNESVSFRRHPVPYRLLVNHAPAEPLYPSFIKGSELLTFVSTIKKGTLEQANEIRSKLGIGDYLSNPTGSYSSGMLKKLSLLLAFVGNPAWILLDEPFTTLDQPSRHELAELIRVKNAKGISFIITSHHDEEIAQLPFTRVFLLNNKTLQEET